MRGKFSLIETFIPNTSTLEIISYKSSSLPYSQRVLLFARKCI